MVKNPKKMIIDPPADAKNWFLATLSLKKMGLDRIFKSRDQEWTARDGMNGLIISSRDGKAGQAIRNFHPTIPNYFPPILFNAIFLGVYFQIPHLCTFQKPKLRSFSHWFHL